MKKLIKKLKMFPTGGSSYIILNKGIDTKEEWEEYCKALDEAIKAE